MGRVKDGQPVNHLGMVHRGCPCDASAPVVTDEHRRLSTTLVDQTVDVVGQLPHVVRGNAVRSRGQVIAARVWCDNPKSCCRERLDLQPPAVPELRETMQQNDQRTVAGLYVMQPLVADFGVTLTNVTAQNGGG